MRKEIQEMGAGTVKWFNESQGSRLITQDDGEGVFSHYSFIRSEGFKTRGEGEKVSKVSRALPLIS